MKRWRDQVAIQYLAEGGIRQMPRIMTAEMLARRAVYKKLTKKDRERMGVAEREAYDRTLKKIDEYTGRKRPRRS